MEEVLRIGIIGMGFMGRIHANNYSKLHGVKVTAIADKNEMHLMGRWTDKSGTSGGDADIELTLDDKLLFSDARELIEEGEVDVIDICLPTPFHYEFARLALDHEKQVIVEKPLTQTSGQAYELILLAEKKGLVLMGAYPLNFWPSYQKLKEELASSRYGRLLHAALSRYCASPQWSPDGWVMDTADGGGVLLDMQIHDIDYVISLFDMPVSVSCSIRADKRTQLAASRLNYNSFHVDISSYWVGANTFPFSSHVLVMCEKAALQIKVEAGRDEVKVYNDSGANTLELPKLDPYVRELEYFIECIKSKEKPILSSLQTSYLSLRVAEALSESARNNERLIEL